MRPRLLVLVMLCLIAGGVSAAEFRVVERKEFGSTFELDGPIREGDLQKFLNLKPQQDDILLLNSNGGNFQTGLALAKFLHENWVMTAVLDGKKCLSACAIAFLGGTHLGEEGSVEPARSIGRMGQVGFHAPFLDVEDGQYDKARVEDSYDRAVRTIVDVVKASDFLQVEPSDAAELMRAQRQELLYLDRAGDLGRYKAVPGGRMQPDYLTATMVRSLCANGWHWSKNYRLGIAPHNRSDIFEESLRLMDDQNWDPVKATYRSKDPIGGGNMRTTVVPATAGPEASTIYCMVDVTRQDDGEIRIECRGFDDSETLAQAIDYAKGNYAPRMPCEVPIVFDPTDLRDTALFDKGWALVPPDTRIENMHETLKALQGEKPIPLPKG